MSKRYRGIKMALVAVLAGALGLPALAAARGDGDRDGGRRGYSGEGRHGDWGRGGNRWDGGRSGRDWGDRGPRHHGHGYRGPGRRNVVVERPAYGWRRAPVVVPWQPAPVIAPWGRSGSGVTVILRDEW
ncbi:MAG TPA: hypothetical protein VES73_00295 [Lamprocystis sp. (in: g-proteobacteria)]|nr:hypothetical protein [Lamprocystis sp. (in: g-proteobacteria)]